MARKRVTRPVDGGAAGVRPVVVALLLAGLLAGAAAVALYRSPAVASNFWVVPDEVEYAVGAHRLVEEGKYEILVGGRSLPPRYPPWFSALVVAPAYVIFGREPGAAIFPVTLLGICGVLAAFAAGKRASGAWGGIAAGLGLLALPDYRYYGRLVLTDVPATALLLCLAALYAREREGGGGPPGLRSSLGVGALAAFAALLRPVSAAGLLPFLWLALRRDRERAPVRFAALLGPLSAAFLASALYNLRTFGTALRGGYGYWCAVPHDYLSLTFSAAFVRANVEALRTTEFLPLAGCLVVAVAWLRFGGRKGAFGLAPGAGIAPLLEFAVVGTGPILLFHLVYFFPSSRFFLPTLACMAVVAGAAIGVALRRVPEKAAAPALALVVAALVAWRLRTPDWAPSKRAALERIRGATPPGAWIVSAIEPAYLEGFPGHGEPRRIIPVSRRVEYANKVLSPERVTDPSLVVQAPWADEAGRRGADRSRWAIPWVAEESPEALGEALARGIPVYLETSAFTADDAPFTREISRRFAIRRAGEELFELRAR